MAKGASNPKSPTLLNNQALISDPEFAPFEGHWHRPVKTSIARKDGRIVPVEKFANLGALLATLVPDDTMRLKHTDLRPRSLKAKQAQQSGDTGPQARKDEELRNVQVTAWVCAVKYEWGKTGDNDFHVILSSDAAAGAGSKFMTAEVSALPVVKAAKRQRRQTRSRRSIPRVRTSPLSCGRGNSLSACFQTIDWQKLSTSRRGPLK